MKRLGVAGLVRYHDGTGPYYLFGRRGKDPNRGKFVLPGGGVEEGESLDEALARELREECSLEIPAWPARWQHPHVIELAERIVLIALVVMPNFDRGAPVGWPKVTPGDDLYDLAWFPAHGLPQDVSPIFDAYLSLWGLQKFVG